MADVQLEGLAENASLNCYIFKFPVKNCLDKISRVGQSVADKCLFYLNNDGRLQFIRLDRKCSQTTDTVDLPNIKSVLLNKGPHAASSHGLTVSVVTHDHDLMIYSYQGDELTSLATVPVKDLVPKEIDIGSSLQLVEIVQFLDELIVLDINEKILLSLQYKDGRLTPLAAIEMAGQRYGSKHFQVIKDTAAVFQIEANKIFFYSLLDGKPLTTLDTTFLGINPTALQLWQFSEDLKILLIVFQSGDLLHVDLEQSAPEWLAHIQRDKNEVANGNKSTEKVKGLRSSLRTCQIGLPSWREKLVSMHQRPDLMGKKKGSLEANLDKVKTGGKPKVTGFKSKDRRLSTALAYTPTSLEAPKGLQGYSVEGISIGLSSLILVYTYNDVTVLCTCNIQTGSWTLQRFTEGEKILLAVSPSMPHLVVTETHLLCVLTDQSVDQEHFVSELMVYAGGTIADAVCHINKWGRCSLPIHTLELGLKHRQVDTVAFFLKSKENMFSAAKIVPGSPQSPMESPSWTSHYNHYDSLTQLEPALQLLLKSARGSMGDKLAQVFAKQILDTTMDFLYGLLLDGLGLAETLSEMEEKENLHKATEKLLEYIEETRSCVRHLEARPRTSRTESVSAGSLSTVSVSNMSIEVSSQKEINSVDSHFGEWDEMNLEAVIEDGIMTNRMLELQQYLLDRGESARGDYSNIEKAGLNKAVMYMKEKEMEKAREILTKLGLDISRKLWEIALYTLDMNLCNFILEELQSFTTLQPDQVAMVTFLKELNVLYPYRNFEHIRDMQHHVKDSGSPETLRLKALTSSSPKYDLTEHCSNLSTGSSEESEVSVEPEAGTYPRYSEVMLDWVQDWDQKTRDLIKLDAVLYAEGSNLDLFSKETIWEYLQSHNMADVMINWIHASFHGDKAEQKKKWPVSHLGALPADFVDQLDFCPSYTKWKVRKTFARYSIYDSETIANFSQLLHRLNETGGLLTVPHPLKKCPFVQVDQFHLDLLQYCIEHKLHPLLWSYCSTHRVKPEFLQNISEAFQSDSWLPMFTQFYAITDEKKYERKLMYDASISNAVNVWGKDTSCVGEMMQHGHILAALATLMYSTQQVQQVTFVTQQMEAFDGLSSETVERAIQAYPKLRVTLFPTAVADSPQLDISVYQLLVGNAPFDPSRLFGWQSTNHIAGEDAPKEMPYFSQAKLVSQFAYSEQLHYTYYLKQGRPSFAFVTFLAEELKNGAQTISNKRLMVAIGTSLWIGVKNFHHSQISSACVLFQELLGHDSVLLRTYIQVGNLILNHRNNAVTGPMDKRREMVKQNETDIVELLLNCVQSGKKYGPQVLHTLEAAILESVTRDRLSPSAFECGQRWSVAVLFCHLMRLPCTTVFLESCAQTNKWLPFIWFAQMHQYSKEQLQNLLHLFKSPYLQEHLRYVLVNADIRSSEEEEKKKLSKKLSDNAAKEMRSTLYSRIGLSIEKESDGTSTEEEDQPTVLNNDPVVDDSEDIQVTYEGSPGDVFGVIFAAQGSKSTWKSLLLYSTTLRNPLFAELAASDKDATTVSCLCCWLVAMMDITEHAQFQENHGKSPWRYSLQTLDTILDIYVKHKWGSVLVTGFDIFQQNSPLLPFLQFYAEFTERRNFDTCKLLLDEFKECIFQFHHEKSSRSADQIGSSDWLEATTYRIIHYMLTYSDNVYEVTQLLKILDSESITLIFSKEDPDFRKQSQIMQVIQAAGIRHVDCAALFSPMSASYQTECKRITSLMMSQQLYDEARKFAAVTETPADHITLAQVESQKSRLTGTQLWLSLPARSKFYRDCAEAFKQQEISAVKIAEFFEKEASLTDSVKQKAFLYELCLSCCKGDDSAEDLERMMSPDLYRKLWLYRIQERVQVMEQGVMEGPAEDDMFGDLEQTSQKSLLEKKKDLAYHGKMPHPEDKPQGLSDKEMAALKSLTAELLENGEISEACRVVTEFSLYSQDLAVILTCIRLSLGTLNLDHLEPHMLHLLRTEPGNIHRQSIAAPVPLLRNSSAISLVSNIQPVLDILSVENEEKIAVMERILKHCEKGVSVCRRVITAFKIAAVLSIGYDDVVLGDDYNILRSLLKTECSGKFRLAQDFLGTSTLSPAEVAGFLSDAIIQSYKVSLGDAAEDQELFFDPGENFADFHQIVRLCKEPSLLGDRLLDALAAMAGSAEQISDKVLTLQTEVLILAHECHTAACNMEGISNILRAARILTSFLESSQEFSLMTRLLTGVGRYNEMIYIFDVLKQNHQFELLLGKGMEKETKLKTAILDYLKRYHPTDSETYSMVALNLMMYREIAQQLENKAVKGLDRLKGKPLENNSETETALKNIAQYFSEAAESYIKDNCLRHAQTCVRKARLVALQLKHLPSSQQLKNLTTKGANLLIADHPVFTEAYIISEAYAKRDNWAAALCNNVIIRGDMKYLQEFRSHIRLTPFLIQDAVERYQQLPEKPPQSLANIKKLLPFCKDIKLQYKLAKDLGIRDFISALEKGDSKSYIQDFVQTLS